jgi:hypothetical protein
MMLIKEMESTKEESHHEIKSGMESHTLSYNQGIKAAQTHLDIDECVEDPAVPVESIDEKVRLRPQSGTGIPYEQVVSENNHKGYRKGNMHCKKSMKDVMTTHISRPEIIKDKSKPHTKVQVPKKKIHSTASKEALLAVLPPQSSSTTHAGVFTVENINRQNPILAAAPTKWRPRELGQGRDVSTTTIITCVLAMVLTLACLVWYAKMRKRKGRIMSLGRRGVSLGPWDERAEEGMVICEDREYTE